MWRLPDPRFEVATALDQGARDYQEDSIVADFAVGDDCGMIVLADGMGGEAAGDIASKMVVTEVFSTLKFHSESFFHETEKLPTLMSSAIRSANDSIEHHIAGHSEARGMGSTVVAAIMAGDRLYWTSVGDSPLYHFRRGNLQQLNEDHSMAPQIDAMARSGLLTQEEAKFHPDRNCLTSAVCGTDIARMDNRSIAYELQAGDIIVVSSDGLQFLEDHAIERLIHKNRRKPSSDIANALLHAVKKLDHPDQDNISIAVVKVNHVKPVNRPMRESNVTSMSFHSTRMVNEDSIEEIGGTLVDPEQPVAIEAGSRS